MPKREKQTPKHKHHAPLRSRKRRISVWMAKAFGWLVAMAIVGVLVLSLVVFIAYKNRVTLVNNALAKLTKNYRLEVEAFEFYEWNRLEVDGLLMTPIDAPEDARPTRIEQVEITFDLDELRASRKVKAITLTKPQIRVDDRALKALGIGEKSESESGDADIKLSFLGKFADSFEVKDGEFYLDISGAPPVKLDWNFRTTALNMADSETWMTDSPMEMRLGNVRVGTDAEFGTIEEILIDLNLSSDFQRISVEKFGITSPDLTVTPDWFSESEKAEKVVTTNQQGTFDEQTLLDREKPKPLATRESFFMLKEVFLKEGNFAIEGFEGIPNASFATTFDFEGFRWGDGMFDAGSPMNFSLEAVRFGELASVPKIDFRANWMDFLTLNWVDSIVLHKPEILVTEETLAAFSSEKKTEESGEDSEPGKPFLVRKLEVWDGTTKVALWESGARISGGVNLNLAELEFGGEAGFRSPASQILWIDEFSMSGPEENALSLISFPAGRAQFQFDQLLNEKRVESIAIVSPRIDIQDSLLEPWTGEGSSEDTEPEKTPDADGDSAAFWTIADLRLTDGVINVDTKMGDGSVPKLAGEFSLLSQPSISDNPEKNPGYRLAFSGMNVRNRPAEMDGELIDEREVASIQSLTIDATAAGLQRDKRIEKIDVEGGVLKIGKALNSMANTGEKKEQEPAENAPQAAASTEAGWTIGELSIEESVVRFEGLVEEIEGLEFQVKTQIKDIPLTEEGLLASTAMNKIELSELEIRDPYDGFGRVLDLPTIFVEFTMAGLLEQRVHKIDVLSPRLYVGEGLFRWNEYRKKYMEQNEGASLELEDGENPVADEGWKIGEVNATLGKIVIAPKGYPIGFVPFPFEASSNFETGDISFNLEIPEENYVYDFPQYKTKLFGLKGKVEFNKKSDENPNPADEDVNNFVQTFEVDRAVWKQFEAETLSLSVTLDEEVVHGAFYAKIYDGDINGEFNYYLKQDDKWDAWISGVNLDTKPLTAVLTPENFDMEGRVTGTIVSQGVALEFGETTGDFTTLEPGKFDVTKLQKIIEDLPEEWSVLQRSATALGLETMKEFNYEEGSGELYFLNRDGWLEMKLKGEDGLRSLKVNVHDWRGKGESDKTKTAQARSE